VTGRIQLGARLPLGLVAVGATLSDSTAIVVR
jgi:hypothetical protein